MQEDITALIKGHQKFRKRYFDTEDTTFAELVRKGQHPKALMVACSDSRVDPALVMDCQPGDLFVIRNVANLVPPYEEDKSYHGTSAALEFGVCVLGIRHVILFGHTQCGGIQSLLDRSHEQCGPKSFLTKWMELAKTAHDATISCRPESLLEEQVTFCGQYSLVNSLKNLQTFPWIRERVNQGILRLHAWNFNMSQGSLEEYDEKQNSFRMIQLPRTGE
ncbi:MAG: cynT [Alphaproteobacteria bacterium]|jgi:carbonic anhydrase|nr:cynT [Alphaproteobacteria bacterium]MDF3033108.1 cynT [Alphaproteobacteria bacterium]